MRSCPGKLDSGAAYWITGAIGVIGQHVWDVRVNLPAGHATQASEGARAVWFA